MTFAETLPTQPSIAHPAVPATPPRVDLYAGIHKALRLFMTDTLVRVGSVDLDDRDEFIATLSQVEQLLDACRSHLEHENRFVHTALESRQPGASARVAAEHEEHCSAIAALEADAASLRALPHPAALHRFYRHLALFTAENFEHMNIEETVHNAALWASHSDLELRAVHQRLVASIAPAEMAALTRWIVVAASPAERAAMLGEMQQQMPPEAMRAVLDNVRLQLHDRAWGKLARALGIAPVPGLVCA